MQDITPPHDILGKVIGDYLPEDPKLRAMMEQSFAILDNHPLNVARAKAGKNKPILSGSGAQAQHAI